MNEPSGETAASSRWLRTGLVHWACPSTPPAPGQSPQPHNRQLRGLKASPASPPRPPRSVVLSTAPGSLSDPTRWAASPAVDVPWAPRALLTSAQHRGGARHVGGVYPPEWPPPSPRRLLPSPAVDGWEKIVGQQVLRRVRGRHRRPHGPHAPGVLVTPCYRQADPTRPSVSLLTWSYCLPVNSGRGSPSLLPPSVQSGPMGLNQGPLSLWASLCSPINGTRSAQAIRALGAALLGPESSLPPRWLGFCVWLDQFLLWLQLSES